MSYHSKSILQPEDDEFAVCFETGRTDHLDRHHIFNGAKKGWSEKNGCWIWLTHDYHMWIHHTGDGRKRMYQLKAITQRKWEELHADDYDHRYENAHDQFMHEVGKDYGRYL